MQVRMSVESPRDLARVANVGIRELAKLFECSVSLIDHKMRGRRPWYKNEVKLFHDLVKSRGATVSMESVRKLIGRENIFRRPLWSRRNDSVTGGSGRS